MLIGSCSLGKGNSTPRDHVAARPDHTRGAWRPVNSVVIRSLRNQIATESTGQFHQDNQSASAPLSRQNRQTPRVFAVEIQFHTIDMRNLTGYNKLHYD